MSLQGAAEEVCPRAPSYMLSKVCARLAPDSTPAAVGPREVAVVRKSTGTKYSVCGSTAMPARVCARPTYMRHGRPGTEWAGRWDYNRAFSSSSPGAQWPARRTQERKRAEREEPLT